MKAHVGYTYPRLHNPDKKRTVTHTVSRMGVALAEPLAGSRLASDIARERRMCRTAVYAACRQGTLAPYASQGSVSPQRMRCRLIARAFPGGPLAILHPLVNGPVSWLGRHERLRSIHHV